MGTLSLYDGDGQRLHTIQMGATLEYGKENFYTRFDRELEQIRARYPKACFIGIADGAKSNWEYLKPRTDEQTVDYWHASGYLGKAAEAMFVGKRKEGEKRENGIRSLIGGKVMNTIIRVTAILFTLTGFNAAYAAGGYMGAAVGQGSFVDDGSGFDETARAYKVYVGKRLFKYLGMEGYYIDFGDADRTAASGNDNSELGFEVSGFALSLTGIAPLHKRLSLFAKAGLLFAETTTTSALNGMDQRSEDRSGELIYGVGGSLHFSPGLAFRIEWEAVESDAVETELASLGIQLNF